MNEKEKKIVSENETVTNKCNYNPKESKFFREFFFFFAKKAKYFERKEISTPKKAEFSENNFYSFR